MTIYAFLNPLSLEEKKLLADLSLQAGIPVKAAPVYEICLKEKPDKNFLRRLIIAYRQLGRSDTALERLDDFGLQPDDGELLMLKAELPLPPGKCLSRPLPHSARGKKRWTACRTRLADGRVLRLANG